MIRRHAAFTLIEVLVSTTLILLLVAASWSAFRHAASISERERAQLRMIEDAATAQRLLYDDLEHLHQGSLLRVAVVPGPDGQQRYLEWTFLRTVMLRTLQASSLSVSAVPYKHDLTWVRYRWDAVTGILQRATTGSGTWVNDLGWRRNPYEQRLLLRGARPWDNDPTAPNRPTVDGRAAAMVLPMPRRGAWEDLTVAGTRFCDRPESAATKPVGWNERDLADNDWRWVPGAALPGVGYPWRSIDDPGATSAIGALLAGSTPSAPVDASLRVPGDEVRLQQALAPILQGVLGLRLEWSDLAGRVYEARLDVDPETGLPTSSALDTITVRSPGRDGHGRPSGGVLVRRQRLTLAGAFQDGHPIEQDEQAAAGSPLGSASATAPLPTAFTADVNRMRPTVFRVRLDLSDLTATQRQARVAAAGGALDASQERRSAIAFSVPVCHVLEHLP